MISTFRELYISRVHKSMLESQKAEIVQFSQEICKKPFYEQIRLLFEQIPRLYGNIHTELLSILSETLGHVTEKMVLQSLKELGCKPSGQATLLCGPRQYKLNSDGELELFVDLSIICFQSKVIFVSVKCTKYDLISDSSLNLICERLAAKVAKQFYKHQQSTENSKAV